MADNSTEFSDGVSPYVQERPLPEPLSEKKGIARFLPHAFVGAISALLLALGIHDNLKSNNNSPISSLPNPAPTAEKGNSSSVSAGNTKATIQGGTINADTDPSHIHMVNPNVPFGQDSNDTLAKRVEQGQPVFPGNQLDGKVNSKDFTELSKP